MTRVDLGQGRAQHQQHQVRRREQGSGLAALPEPAHVDEHVADRSDSSAGSSAGHTPAVCAASTEAGSTRARPSRSSGTQLGGELVDARGAGAARSSRAHLLRSPRTGRPGTARRRRPHPRGRPPPAAPAHPTRGPAPGPPWRRRGLLLPTPARSRSPVGPLREHDQGHALLRVDTGQRHRVRPGQHQVDQGSAHHRTLAGPDNSRGQRCDSPGVGCGGAG